MKPRLFLDANIVLDLLGKRLPHYHSIAKIATLADRRKLDLVVSALSYGTVNYFLEKWENSHRARDKLRKLRVISEICDLDAATVEKGLNSNFSDFEDALQYYGAVKSACNYLITRNAKNFKLSEIPIMTAEEFLLSTD